MQPVFRAFKFCSVVFSCLDSKKQSILSARHYVSDYIVQGSKWVSAVNVDNVTCESAIFSVAAVDNGKLQVGDTAYDE